MDNRQEILYFDQVKDRLIHVDRLGVVTPYPPDSDTAQFLINAFAEENDLSAIHVSGKISSGQKVFLPWGGY